jgi:hypothetical protein
MKSPLSTIGLTGVLMVSSFAVTIAVPLRASAQSATPTCHIYQVNIKGTVTNNYGSQAFSVNQYAIWRDRGVRSNQVEFMLKTGTDLNVSPKIGQIELLTNSYFANNAGIASAKIDLAKVQVGNQVNFTLNAGASLQMPQPNVFVSPGVGSSPGGLGGIGFIPGWGEEFARIINESGVLSASYLVPNRGGGSFGFTDKTMKTIIGQLDINGSAIDNPGLNGRYTATFKGNHLQSVACP